MTNPQLSRREFARRMTLGAAATVAAAETLAAEAEPKKPRNEVEARKPRDEAAAERPVEDALLDVIRQRYPDRRLRGGVLQAVRNDLRGDLRRGTTLRRFPLQNSDEPAFVFAAYRADAIR